MTSTPEHAARTPRIGSACSGVGGLDLGVMAVIGGSVAWHVEYDKHPSAVLEARFPGVPNYGDIKTTDWLALELVDWFIAGYPCQPFSDAGLRLGEADERHLWPYVADAIRALRPRNVLLENVRGHLRRGFGTVHGDLATLGYDTRWVCLRASDAGAPHLRSRVFIHAQDADRPASNERGIAAPGQAQGGGAWTDAGGRGGAPAPDAESDGRHEGRPEPAGQFGRPHAAEPRREAAANADSGRREGNAERDSGAAQPGLDSASRVEPERLDEVAWGAFEPAIRRWERVTGRAAPRPTEPGRTGERLSPRFVEWLMGLSAGWVTDVDIPRNAQLMALGNGVVPQQAALALGLLLDLHITTEVGSRVA